MKKEPPPTAPPKTEKVGMWGAINNAVIGGWSTMFRLAILFVIVGAFVTVLALLGSDGIGTTIIEQLFQFKSMLEPSSVSSGHN